MNVLKSFANYVSLKIKVSTIRSYICTNDKVITEIIHYTAGPDISKLLKQIFYNQSIPYT